MSSIYTNLINKERNRNRIIARIRKIKKKKKRSFSIDYEIYPSLFKNMLMGGFMGIDDED